jgi:Mn2+/Fe2+ NRAMP family transporter
MPGLIHSARRRRGAILLVALFAFVLSQALAIAHASRHVGGDAAGLPGNHSQLCTDCASLLPLLAVVGGVGAALALARPFAQVAVSPAIVQPRDIRVIRPFRSRAPPR